MTRNRRLLERCWGSAVTAVASFFALGMIVSARFGGLGIGIEDGHFVMRQGSAFVEVGPFFGRVLFGLVLGVFLSGAAALVSTFFVLVRHGSFRPEVVLVDELRPYGIAIKLAEVFVAVAVLIWMGSAFLGRG